MKISRVSILVLVLFLGLSPQAKSQDNEDIVHLNNGCSIKEEKLDWAKTLYLPYDQNYIETSPEYMQHGFVDAIDLNQDGSCEVILGDNILWVDDPSYTILKSDQNKLKEIALVGKNFWSSLSELFVNRSGGSVSISEIDDVLEVKKDGSDFVFKKSPNITDEYYSYLGAKAYKNKEYKSAESNYLNAYWLTRGESARVANDLAVTWIKQKKLSQAKEMSLAFLNQSRDAKVLAATHFNLGVSYHKEGNLELALAQYRKSDNIHHTQAAGKRWMYLNDELRRMSQKRRKPRMVSVDEEGIHWISEVGTKTTKLDVEHVEAFQQVLAIDQTSRIVFIQEGPRLGPYSVVAYDLDTGKLKKTILGNIEESSSEMTYDPLFLKHTPSMDKFLIFIVDFDFDKDRYVHNVKIVNSKTLSIERSFSFESHEVSYCQLISEDDLLLEISGNDEVADAIEVHNINTGKITSSFSPKSLGGENYFSSKVEDSCNGRFDSNNKRLLLFLSKEKNENKEMFLYSLSLPGFEKLHSYQKDYFFDARFLNCDGRSVIIKDDDDVADEIEFIEMGPTRGSAYFENILKTKSSIISISDSLVHENLILFREENEEEDIYRLHLYDTKNKKIIKSVKHDSFTVLVN